MALYNTGVSSLLLRRVLPSLRHPGALGGVYPPPCLADQRRHLFSRASLGLDQYSDHRQDTRTKFGADVAAFKDKMKEIVKDNDNNTRKAMIFTEDFKNILHLVEGSEEDMELVREMAVRFNKQHQGLRFGMYVFGPVVMRTYHTLGQTQEVLKALNDPELAGFYDQLTSYQLALDLLYEGGHYKEVLDVFETVQERRVGGVRYPKTCLTLALAACYKMNSQDSFQYLQELLQKVKEYGIPLNRRLAVFGASLSLSVGRPDAALSLILAAPSPTHISVRSIKVLALCHLGRLEEAIVTLRAITEIDLPTTHRPNRSKYILREAVKEVEEAVKERGRKEQEEELKRILKFLEECGAISDKTLDAVVCHPIEKFERHSVQERAMLAASFSAPHHPPPPPPRRAHKHTHRPQRQGLMDLD